MAGIDSYTKLMLHMDGTDNGTSFTDDSESSHTITRFNAVTKTGTKKFGTASGYFDGTSDYLTAPDNSDWDFGTGDFTIDFWFKLDSHTAWDMLMHYSNGTANANANWHVSLNDSNQIRGTIFASDTPVTALSTTAINDSQWHHYAFVRNGNNTMVAVDGTFGTPVSVTGLTVRALSSSLVTVGSNYGGGQTPVNFMDEVRISKGIARWTENFTPPTEAYSSSAYVISGGMNEATRVLILKESDWSIESNTTVSGSTFEIEVSDTNDRLVIGRSSDGIVIGYGSVTPSTT